MLYDDFQNENSHYNCKDSVFKQNDIIIFRQNDIIIFRQKDIIIFRQNDIIIFRQNDIMDKVCKDRVTGEWKTE